MEPEKLLNTFLALVFVLALMGLLALAAKKLGLANATRTRAGKRLKVVEVLPLDGKRRAMILQCDDKQHLVILSQNGETVISKDLEIKTEKLEDSDKPFE